MSGDPLAALVPDDRVRAALQGCPAHGMDHFTEPAIGGAVGCQWRSASWVCGYVIDEVELARQVRDATMRLAAEAAGASPHEQRRAALTAEHGQPEPIRGEYRDVLLRCAGIDPGSATAANAFVWLYRDPAAFEAYAQSNRLHGGHETIGPLPRDGTDTVAGVLLLNLSAPPQPPERPRPPNLARVAYEAWARVMEERDAHNPQPPWGKLSAWEQYELWAAVGAAVDGALWGSR